MVEEQSDHVLEIRAVKAIKKEKRSQPSTSTLTLTSDLLILRCVVLLTAEERMITVKRKRGFDCKCRVCSGDVEDKEDVMRQLLELYKTLDSKHDQKKVSVYSASDWTREAKTWTEIVDKTLTLHIGEIYDKFVSVSLLAVCTVCTLYCTV